MYMVVLWSCLLVFVVEYVHGLYYGHVCLYLWLNMYMVVLLSLFERVCCLKR